MNNDGGPDLSSEGIRTAPGCTGDAADVTFIIRLEFSSVCFCIIWVKVYDMNKVEVADDCCFCW